MSAMTERRFSVGQKLRVVSNADADKGMLHYYALGDEVEVMTVIIGHHFDQHYTVERLNDRKRQTLSDWQLEDHITSGKTIKELMA